MGMFNESRDRQAQKSGDRLNKEVAAAQRPAPETGVYTGANTANPYGRTHGVSVGSSGQLAGEMITPSAVGRGQKVAVYRGTSGNLFDAM